jgi:hypothetical protein
MAVLKTGVPLETSESAILVETDPNNPLPIGKHRFQLKVVDDSGNVSDPAELIVQVIDSSRPNAFIDGPSQIEFGKSFELTGSKSVDIGGSIVKYVWTMLD